MIPVELRIVYYVFMRKQIVRDTDANGFIIGLLMDGQLDNPTMDGLRWWVLRKYANREDR
jgi:hypothetical protein